ncbi:unnamed protein product, partial [Effrenium voratum]
PGDRLSWNDWTVRVPGKAQYTVTGFIWHGNDHYVAYLVRGQQWYCLNDAVVTEVSQADLPADPYMIFLQKVVRQRGKSTKSSTALPDDALHAIWMRLPEAVALAATQQLPSCGLPSCEQRQRARPSMGRFARRFARKMRSKSQDGGVASRKRARSVPEDPEESFWVHSLACFAAAQTLRVVASCLRTSMQHGGLQRYRNAFLHMESLCPHVVTGSEVRYNVGNYAELLRSSAMDWDQHGVLLKPSEYTGQKGTAVDGRVVILTHQEAKAKASTADAAALRHGKGSKGKKIADKPSLKLEMHLAGTDSINEVLYVEAWGEQADHLKKKLTQGDLVSIAGATHIPAAQNYSTSRLPYHLRAKGTVGVNVIVQKLDALPCSGVPSWHPLPLYALDRVKERQQICVAVLIEENPGTVERDTSAGRVPVCNAVVQQEGTRVRCAFWREQAGVLAARAQCEAVPSTLSALVGAIIVPGQLRQMDTVFKVWGLQVMGVSSVRSETDEWVLKSCGKCKKALPCQAHPDAALEPRMAVRVDLLILTASVPCCCTTTFSQRSCRTRTSPCQIHWQTPPKCAPPSATFCGAHSAQWLCKLTFRENDYQQVLELDCKHL